MRETKAPKRQAGRWAAPGAVRSSLTHPERCCPAPSCAQDTEQPAGWRKQKDKWLLPVLCGLPLGDAQMSPWHAAAACGNGGAWP